MNFSLCLVRGGLDVCVSLRSHILAGRHTLGALEHPRKIELVEEAHGRRHLGDGQGAAPQQLAGLIDPVFGQVINGAFAHVEHEHPVEVAAGDADALGDVVDGDVVGVVELDVLDGVQDVLAGGRGAVGAALAGLPHQGGDEQVEVAHHCGLILRLQSARGVDAAQGSPHPLKVLRMVDGGSVRKGQLRGQLMGAGSVEADPAVFPGLGLVGRIADELAGAGEEQIARRHLIGAPADLEYPLAGDDQMDEVVVPDAGSPCLPRSAALQTAVEDGQLDVVGVILFEGLFIDVCHCGSLLPVGSIAKVYHICPCKFNKSTSYSLGWTPKITFFAG